MVELPILISTVCARIVACCVYNAHTHMRVHFDSVVVRSNIATL